MPGLMLALLAQAATAAQPPIQPATQPAAPPIAAPLPKPKMICRSYDEIGSLIAKRKVCHTAADWNRVRDTMDDELKRIIGPLPGPGG